MDEYRKMVIDFVDEAIRATGVETRTALARKIGKAATTITRIDDPDSTNIMSLRTAWLISAVSGVPIPQVPQAKGSDGGLKNREEAAVLAYWRDLSKPEQVFLALMLEGAFMLRQGPNQASG
jgi:hypothetical protein